MDERRVADYFVVAGLPDVPEPLEEFSTEGSNLKPTHNQAPITDITVIFRSLGESPPEGYTVIETTTSGLSADLNHGSIRSPSVYFCYRRGRDKPPLVDIGVLYEGKERIMADSEAILYTPKGHAANVNNSGSKTFITFRRALDTAPCNELVVTDICVIISNKGEIPPHTYCTIPKNLNKGMVGSDVYLCYKKSMNRANSIAYKPAVLAEYPLDNREDFPLPRSVPLFCLPMGATIECWPVKAQCPKPVFSTFVLTVSHLAEKVYGAAVTFYERFSEEKLTDSQSQQLNIKGPKDLINQSLNTNKSICILSHWPFFDTFEKFLMYLHRMSVTGPHTLPIERYISHFMLEIPFPSPQRPRILIQLNATERISLAQPEDSPLALSGASFRQLLKTLGPDNCLTLLLYALTEQKLLIHSLRPDVLTSVAEAVSMLIFPFHWQCPYIPLCPLGLSDVLSAPMPYIVGVDSRYFDLYDPPHDVTCVDLDTNTVSPSEDRKGIQVKLLPKKPARTLRSTLQALYERLHQLAISQRASASKHSNAGSVSPIDKDFRFKKQERIIELEIQEAFLRFTASMLKGFRAFLQPITKAPTIGATDCSSLFDMQGFLKSRDKAYQRFYQMLMKTQMFTRFIEERSFVSDKDASLAFFDECTEKVDTGDYPEPRLLELDESQQSERTVFITPPEPFGLPPGITYTYQGFSNLDASLFHARQEIKTWVSSVVKSSPAPSSPMAKRTKQEIRSAQRIAKKHSEKPMLWSKCLVSYCYTLWFIHLPAYVKMSPSKAKALRTAYDVLVKMQAARLQPPDEVCYRVLMQLCGQYSQPILAVKLLSEMKRNGIQPNAITYGYYNKAVLESTWPSTNSNSYLLWNKLRNVIIGVALFKRGIVRRPLSMCSESDFDGVSRGSTEGSSADVSVPDGNRVDTSGDAKTDDVASTGGQSDIGYSSMNTDETQKSSSSISSSSQLTTTDCEMTGSSNNLESAPSSVSHAHPPKSALKDSGSKEKTAHRMLKFEEMDFSASDEFRSRVGSIVRTSASTLSSKVRGEASVESSAGLLITGQASIYDDGHFEGGHLRRGLSWRRRHRSASEYVRQGSRKHRTRHLSGPDHDLTLTSQISHETDLEHEMLRSDSFGSDAKIISQLSVGNDSEDSSNSDEKAGIEADDCFDRLPSSSVDSRDDAFPSTHSTPTNQVLTSEVQPKKSPNVPIRKKSVYSGPDPALLDVVPSTGKPVPLHLKQSPSHRYSEPQITSPMFPEPIPTQLTPVTQNDPLGLFAEAALATAVTANSATASTTTVTTSKDVDANSAARESWFDFDALKTSLKARANSLTNPDGLVKVTRSATFCHSPQHTLNTCSRDLTSVSETRASLPRSSSVQPETPKHQPIRSTSASSLMSPSLSNLVGFKLSFSPSPRKTDFLFGSLKSAASSLGSKLSEIKEAISNSSGTPIKIGSVEKPSVEQKLSSEEDGQPNNEVLYRTSVDYLSRSNISDEINLDELDNLLGEARQSRSLVIPHDSTSPSLQDLLQSTPKKSGYQSSTSVAVEIIMTSCSRCYTCSSILYDEEIMIGWTAEDSNLNTRCQFCQNKLVPFLCVTIRDHRVVSDEKLSAAPSMESVQSAQSATSLLSQKGPAAPENRPESGLVLGTSVESDNFMLLEDSPESVSLSSGISSPLGSPQKQITDGRLETPAEPPIFCKSKSPEPRSSNVGIHSDSRPSSDATSRHSQGHMATLEECAEVEEFSPRGSGLAPVTDNGSLASSRASSVADVRTKGDSRREASPPPIVLEPISVPYLSPIVLRKEMENVLEHEGDSCLSEPHFVDEHPIIYWNLVWFFKRIDVPSHLPGLCLNSNLVNKEREIPAVWASADSSNVLVRCLWDNPKLHEDIGRPMYILWSQTAPQSSLVHALVTEQQTVTKDVMQKVISGIKCNDLLEPMKLLLTDIQKKRPPAHKRHYSIYRDILFLALTSLGRENINQASFEREYRRAYEKLSQRQIDMMRKCDYPPSLGVILCRQTFQDLEL